MEQDGPRGGFAGEPIPPGPSGGQVAMALLLAAAIGASVTAVVRHLGEQPLQAVRIAGEFRAVDEPRLEAAIEPHLDAGFFAVDVAAVQASAEALPWVRRVSVRRVWPGSLHLAVVERVPVARWNDDALLEGDGTAFRPDTEGWREGLPGLRGPEGREGEVLAAWRRFEAALATVPGARVSGVTQTLRGSWEITLSGDTTLVLGPEQGPEALEALAPAFTRIFAGDFSGLERIDLRYANGFAVRPRATGSPLEEG
jgi:cell division protein FtsQ